MFREIRTREKIERITDKVEEENGYLQIKPKGEMTIEECNDFWANVFALESSKAAEQ